MKKIFALLIPSLFLFAACQGPQGPQGPQGVPGQDGGLEYATAIELVVDFTPANNYQIVENFGFDVFPADVPLVYILWDTDDNGTEIWRPLPQTTFLTQGALIYNYDFTQADFSLFLDGTISDFSSLSSGYLNNQVFRVVVVPAAFLQTARLADKSYETITGALGLSDSDFVKRDLR
ncbi:hypothetical protein LAG90_19230 [Marinilongibacter aquaticus]|uniref:hypothetical protein n=1 Tax=Marinilongibacter aquaticus TaxID=2975157 RepID=UPI0021BD2342|nr:hypothetical protein [Marinilongibacter aquaticus]UBM58934.1 hypothetical protein LAG90_19230 [Marinilongibacter aquaticus]